MGEYIKATRNGIFLCPVIGDEDTCTGFLLGGIGEINKARSPNFLVVDKNTSVGEIDECFKGFLQREDIAIILINQVGHGLSGKGGSTVRDR